MSELGTTYTFVGGNNMNRIGGNCSVLEHKHDKYNRPTRIMFDLGALFAPEYCLDVDAAIPDVRQYLDSKTSYAEKRLDAIFLSHAHEDHIGGLVHLARAGYSFPPIYASKASLELLKTGLIEAGVDLSSDEWKEKFVEIKPEKPVNLKGVEIEAFNVSHSTIGALGFHSLTTIDGKVEAGILHPGDFHLGKTYVDVGFDEEKFNDLLDRKPVTQAMLDSTSSDSSDEYLVTFDEAVKNTVEAINEYPENQVISAVISRSIENLAIDIEAARQTCRKIFLDGYGIKNAYKAMRAAGFKNFDDVIFFGSANEYKAKVPESQRYIITSGAFAESKKGAKSGLYKMSEQEKMRQTKNKKEVSKADISGHPDFKVGSNSTIKAGQRCIEEINGIQVRAMYARLAALGCPVFANFSKTSLGNYKTVKIQRSGHAVKSEIKRFVELILAKHKNVTFIPIHGNRKQLENTINAIAPKAIDKNIESNEDLIDKNLVDTAQVVKQAGGKFFFANNLDKLKLSNNKTSLAGKIDSLVWIGVCEETDNTSSISTYKYMEVDENFVVKNILGEVKVERPRKDKYLKKDMLNQQSNNFRSKQASR